MPAPLTADFTIEGIQAAQDEILRAQQAISPRGAFGEAIKAVVIAAHREEEVRIHVDTGALRASRVYRIRELRGEVYSLPGAVNPISGERVVDYAPIEFGRGGEHDAPGRVIREAGPGLERLGRDILLRGIR